MKYSGMVIGGVLAVAVSLAALEPSFAEVRHAGGGGGHANANRNVNRNTNVNRHVGVAGGAYHGGAYHGAWTGRAYRWAPGGAIAAGAAIGFIAYGTAVAWAPPPPQPGLCWYYTDATQRNGFWDSCP